MTRLSNALRVNGSNAAVVVGASLVAAPAMAQHAGTTPPVEELVVTGTSIRGAATVESNLITVDPKTIEQSGATSAQDRRMLFAPKSNRHAGPPLLEDSLYVSPRTMISISINQTTMLAAIGEYAGWGFVDYRQIEQRYTDGYQSLPVDWGINSARNKGSFSLLAEVTAGQAPLPAR